MLSTQGTPSDSAMERPQVEDRPARMARAGRQAPVADSSMRRNSGWAARRKRDVEVMPFSTPPLVDAAIDPEAPAMRSLGLPSRAANPMPRACDERAEPRRRGDHHGDSRTRQADRQGEERLDIPSGSCGKHHHRGAAHACIVRTLSDGGQGRHPERRASCPSSGVFPGRRAYDRVADHGAIRRSLDSVFSTSTPAASRCRPRGTSCGIWWPSRPRTTTGASGLSGSVRRAQRKRPLRRRSRIARSSGPGRCAGRFTSWPPRTRGGCFDS